VETDPTIANRRSQVRQPSRDVIRWKRPGRIEDQKGWAVDHSAAGIGFMTAAASGPLAGELIHIRRLDGDRWATIDRIVRVAHASPTANHDVLMVGCSLEENCSRVR